MRPGTAPNPPRSTASAAGLPVIMASVPTAPARAVRAGTAPGWARASPGRSTIGASVPSKSAATSACRGSASSASRPAWPSGVADPGGEVIAAASSGLPLGALRPGRPHALPTGPLGAQPLDEHRVECQRLGPVYQLVQQLVVPGGRHVEHLGDGLLLHAGRSPGSACHVRTARTYDPPPRSFQTVPEMPGVYRGGRPTYAHGS